MTPGELLRVDGLRVTHPGPPPVRAVDDISFTVAAGECLAVLGESGSGKSTLARSLLGLQVEAETSGSITFDGTNLAARDDAAWRSVRWQRIALVFQSTTALNPVLRVDAQVAEPLVRHRGQRSGEARRRAGEALARVGLDAGLHHRYPHELSGGQRRLALVAMAMVCEPDLLVLDEPTAGLDPITRRHLLDLLRHLRRDRRQTLMILTHDVDALAGLADRVQVMYRGSIAETGPAETVVDDPRHPYTFGLLNARPTLGTLKDLRGIRGAPPDPTALVEGCGFAERCTQVIPECHLERPPPQVPDNGSPDRLVACIRGGLVPVLTARGLRKAYSVKGERGPGARVTAVDGVDLDVREGEVVGLVGPNGAGKSTLGQLLLRLVDADAGSVVLEGVDLLTAERGPLRHARRRAQMLFQDPYEALSPRLTVAEAVREPLDVQRVGTPAERDAMVIHQLEEVRLPAGDGFAGRRTHELSGGQLQRVALARALVLEPKLLIADEPLEGLDPSEQAKMLQLLKALQVERGMAMIIVSHDLAIVLRTADRVVVMDQGRVVERGSSTRVFVDPQHDTTRRLLSAAGRDAVLSTNGHHPQSSPTKKVPL